MNKTIRCAQRTRLTAVSNATIILSSTLLTALPTFAAVERDEALQQRVDSLEQQLEAVVQLLESGSETAGKGSTHFGGYGELHYNHLEVDGTDQRTLDMHRVVIYIGHEFNERARLVTELEVEHAISSASSNGAVEVEQAFIEIDLNSAMQLQSGVLLMPIGIISETHEPPTFGGVERPVVETTIIPTTWYAAGVGFRHRPAPNWQYDLLVTDGFKTADPTTDSSADAFDLKGGKQKGSLADAFDLALTARVRYRGASGLELAAYTQHQPDLDQSAADSYAESATLLGAHAIYQWDALTAKLLYAHWDVSGDAAAAAGKDVQAGGYLELGWRLSPQWLVFGRQSQYSQQEDQDATQSKVGVNYYFHPDIVFKADYQLQNDDAGDADGFNLGMGYQF